MKARNQLLNNGEMPDMRTIGGKHNTMGLGVFRSTKIALAFGTAPEPSYLQRSQQMHGQNRNNLKAMNSLILGLILLIYFLECSSIAKARLVRK